MVELTAAHWVYAFFVIVILVTMTLRKDTPLVCIVATFVLGWVVTGDIVKAVQAVFNAINVAFSDLLGIVVIISLIVSMAKMLEETGMADMMFKPIQRMMVSPEIAFWVMGVVIMIVAWVIWPSPAIALVGALLLPAAIKAGLSPINAAMAISMFGYGCALTTDFIIQGAPGITAKAAGVTVDAIMWKTFPMLLVFAAIALPLSFYSARKDIKANAGKPIEWAPFEASAEDLKEREKWTAANPGFKKIALPIIAILFALDVVGMLVFKLRGGDATALLGGTVGIVMVFVGIGAYGREGFEKLTNHTRAGFMFGVKIFAPVFLIAAFFFMGAPGTAKAVFGEGARGLLFDLGQALANTVPLSPIPVALVEAVVAGLTGLDGSGFAGLPLAGSLAQALGGPTHIDVATLGALGQFFAVCVGGGTIIPWAVIPAAAITGTDPVEIARRNLWPTMAGFVGVIIVAIFML
jgi:TRAP-type C4-dicarboxylate transport system permease large subunit